MPGYPVMRYVLLLMYIGSLNPLSDITISF